MPGESKFLIKVKPGFYIREEKAAPRRGKKRASRNSRKTWSSGRGSGGRREFPLPTSVQTKVFPRQIYLEESTNQPKPSVIQMDHSDKHLKSFMVLNEYQCPLSGNEQLCFKVKSGFQPRTTIHYRVSFAPVKFRAQLWTLVNKQILWGLLTFIPKHFQKISCQTWLIFPSA